MGEAMGAGGRILVVADSRVARSRLVAQLAPHGFTLVETGNGDEAMARAAEDLPDVILLDVELPGEDGFAVLDRLKAEPAVAHVPVVFISQRTATAVVADGLERGAHDYLRKPVEPAELVARVMGAVRLKALQDQLRSANDALRHTAGTDPLTGLPNRRMAAEHLDRLISRARRHALPFVLVITDLDGFKGINDELGHAHGDRALIAAAERLESVCRSEDLLARWGGDEFLILSSDADEGAALSDRLRVAVGDGPLQVETYRLPMTVSVGWTRWLAGDDPDDVLSRADAALYRAKATGGAAVASA
jgi:two-component system cell cycle response regulator